MYHKLTLIIFIELYSVYIYNGYCYSLTGVNCSTQGADAKKKRYGIVTWYQSFTALIMTNQTQMFVITGKDYCISCIDRLYQSDYIGLFYSTNAFSKTKSIWMGPNWGCKFGLWTTSALWRKKTFIRKWLWRSRIVVANQL